MNLISLELQGFKSFPDKVKLDFGKGITGVVGPNGSGKSNIGDAMRWVLGEQSSKTLRGDKMEDVVFSGTQKRKPLGFAAVTLNIDNTDRSLQMDADVVSVTRKLYRRGDSEYILNGEQVRLKDVVELFMDTGLGKDGYSIIGQGRIAEIVSSKAGDRREIFEEAAGISKFRYKKQQAEKRLADAEDNILRLTDIIGELEGRIEPLRIQSEKAKRFKLLDDEKQKLEISVWVHRMGEMRSVLDGLEAKIAAVTKQYEQNSGEAEELEKSVEVNLMKSAECLSEIDGLREDIHRIELESSQSQSEIAVLENDISHISEAVEGIKKQIEQSYLSSEKLEEQRLKKLADAQTLDSEASRTDDLIASLEGELNDLAVKDSAAEREAAEKSSEISALYIRSSELAFMLENSKNISTDVSEQSDGIIAAKSETETALDEAGKQLREKRSLLSELEQKISDHTNRLNGFAMLSRSKMQELEKEQSELEKCSSEMSEKSQRLRILRDLENSMEGLSGSVQKVLRASKQGRIGGILGSVSQLVTTSTEYSIAVETALGGALQNVVVENEDSAKRCIRLLKEEKAGRATFLPLTSVKGRTLSESGLESCEGFIATADKLVDYDVRLENIVLSLLGRTVVAENLDCGAGIAKKFGYRFRIVTLDGQIINAGGSFTGGSAARVTGLLTRKNQIEKLEGETEELKAVREKLSTRLSKLRQEAGKLSADSEAEKELIASAATDKVRMEAEIARLWDLRTSLENRLDEQDLQLRQLAKRLADAEKELDNAQSELTDVKLQIAEKEAALTRSRQAASMTRAERERLTENLSAQRLHRVELVKDAAASREAADQLARSIRSIGEDRSSFEEQIKAQLGEVERKKGEIDRIRKSVADVGDRISEKNRLIEQKQAKHRELDTLAARQRALLKIKNDEREELSQDIARTSEKRTAVNDEYDKIVSSLWEQYELSKSEAAEKAEAVENIAEANKHLTELRNKIRHLGSVNLGAIEEYREVSKRYEFLTKQLRDVTSSKNELEKLISQLTADMKLIFTESFGKINESFKLIFTDLFGGGKAELLLDDPDDVLESGIDIRVAPPGKVIKNLSSLSGGEQAFVAISIYFAILSVKPSPFCLLDEIEAALDDVNVTKYAQYLRKFTDTTQFIAITHRRGTMEEADILYGVTMQEEGVSKLLKMNVDAAAKTVE